MRWVSWRVAMQEALYDPEIGFYRAHAPADHFRTSVHVPAFAAAVVALAERVGAGTLADVGAGRGELLAAVHRLAPDLRLLGVDIVDRPMALPAAAEWHDTLPDGLGDVLVVANELLDNVPVDVVEVDGTGTARLVAVDPSSGAERLGPPVAGADAAWLRRWWPLGPAGSRAEIGHLRDERWASLVSRVRSGVLVAIDYAHTAADRPPGGSLAAYRAGRQVRAVPDGSCDLTAHVALDACAAAGRLAGATATLLTTQAAALPMLGVRATRPTYDLAVREPQRYLAELSRASEVAELVDPGGLGGFGWLVQAVGRDLPLG